MNSPLSNSRIFFLAIMFIALQLSLRVCHADELYSDNKTRVLTYSDHQPSDRMRTRFLNEVLFAAIEDESNGRIKIEAHWDGQLAEAYDALAAVSSGKTDMATTVPEYTSAALPLHQIFKSFPLGPTSSQQIAFFRKVYQEIPAFTDELAENNVVPIFFGTGYPVAFFGRQPLEDLNQLSGDKWRSASFWHLDFLKNAGAIPVRMHWGQEVYDALMSGEIDGLMVNVDSGYFLNVHDVAPFVLVSKSLWLGHIYPVTMNKSTWENLSFEDKQAIQRATSKAYKALGKVMEQSYQSQLEKLKEAGARIRELDSKELLQFQQQTSYESVQEDWASLQEKAGVSKAKSVIAKVKALMDEM